MSARVWSNGQGQGDGTPRKEDGFAAVLRMSLRISRAAAVADRPYWHIDLNAGSGWNDKSGCPGSPLVFLRAACDSPRPGRVNAVFCDDDPAACAALALRLHQEPKPDNFWMMIHQGDNARCLGEVADMIGRGESRPGLAVGTLFCDPNGVRVGFPVDALEAFSRLFPRIDLIINLNASVFAMVRGCKASGRPSVQKGFLDWPDLLDIARRFNRPLRNWWVRNPSKGPGMRFAMLVGRSLPTGRRSFKDFHPLDSPAGQEIIHTLRRVPTGGRYLFEGM